MRSWELTGIPYTSARIPGGIAGAIAALRAHRLAERLGGVGVPDAGDLDLEPPSGERGASGLLNEAALGDLVDSVRERVAETRRAGRRPLLVGGDCPVILGALAALGEGADNVGLVMVDGHEDAWPPKLSETGEASDCELGIALGLASERLPAPLDRLLPLIDSEAVALLGPRDGAEIEAGGARSIRDAVAFFLDAGELERAVADGGEPMSRALAAIDAELFWLHLDLDVLSSEALAAVDYPQPGGLGWERLDQLAQAAAADPRCAGASVVIYNPELDSDGSGAEAVVGFAHRLVEGCSPATPTR